MKYLKQTQQRLFYSTTQVIISILFRDAPFVELKLRSNWICIMFSISLLTSKTRFNFWTLVQKKHLSHEIWISIGKMNRCSLNNSKINLFLSKLEQWKPTNEGDFGMEYFIRIQIHRTHLSIQRILDFCKFAYKLKNIEDSYRLQYNTNTLLTWHADHKKTVINFFLYEYDD